MFKSAWGESWDVCDPGDLLQYLIPAVGEALQAIDDPNEAAEILLGVHDEQGPEGPEAISMLLHASMSGVPTSALHDACATAVECGGDAVVELLVDAFADRFEEPEVAKLIANMEAIRGPTRTDPPGSEILMHALGDVVSTEGIRFLWEHYEEHLGWDGGLDQAELLLRMYEEAVCAVTDPRWLADRVLEVCEFIASADDDTSAWLPDRERVSDACKDTIDASGGPVATRDAMREPFWLAVKNAGDPRGAMAETFRSVTDRIEDHVVRHIADVHVATGHAYLDVGTGHALRALVEAIAILEDPEAEIEVMYTAYVSALRDSNDPSAAVEALLEATKNVIEQAEDRAQVLKVLLNGLSVQPVGWPPPLPIWLRV